MRVVETPPGREGPGSQLRAKRQERGLDLAEVAAQLHLTSAVIQQLERDDYEGLGHVFAIGYLRNYARLLRLDPEPYVELYRTQVQNVPTPVPRPARPQKRRLSLLPLSGLFLFLVVGIMGLWYVWSVPSPRPKEASSPDFSGDAPPAEPASSVPVERQEPAHSGAASPPVLLPSEPALVSMEPEPPQPSSSVPSGGVLESPPPTPAEPQVSTESSVEPGPAPEPEQLASPPEVVLEFSGPCWVDLRDSSRKFKHFGEMKAGDRLVLKGTPPYSILLGNAAVVRMTIGGEPFDLSQKTRGNVAKFTLDPTR